MTWACDLLGRRLGYEHEEHLEQKQYAEGAADSFGAFNWLESFPSFT